MNIDDLTFGQIKQLQSIFGGTSTLQTTASAVVGKYCVARCYAAGVHAGEVVSVDGETVVLKNSRRLWSWDSAAEAVALSGVAQFGLKSGCKVDIVNPEILLTGMCELIVCTDVAKKSIHEYKK